MSSSENVISAGTTSKEKKNEEHEENLSMKLDKFYRFKPISRPNIAYGSVAQHLTTREYSDRSGFKSKKLHRFRVWFSSMLLHESQHKWKHS